MDFDPIPRELVSDKIIEQIKNKIDVGEFQPGERLPSEVEMSRSFNVARSTVREALKVLVYIGILKRKGRSTFVSPNLVNSNAIVKGLSSYRDHHDMVDLIEVRRILEVQIVEFAAERADETDLSEIEACLIQMPTDTEAISSFIESDKKFHLLLAKAAKNKILLKMMENIRKNLNIEVATRNNPNIIQRSVSYHHDLILQHKGTFQSQSSRARSGICRWRMLS